MEKFVLYGGDVELMFDTDKHIYTIGDKVVYGVTSIVGVLSKPALVNWAAKMSADRFKELIQPGAVYSEVQLAEFYGDIKGAHYKRSSQALDIGTIVHDWIEGYITYKLGTAERPIDLIDKRAKGCADAFLDWESKHSVKYVYTERKIYSKKHEYAGTLDILAIVDNELTVIDIKTSSGIYEEYFLQTAAYSLAIEEEFGKKVGNNIILRVDKTGAGFEACENKDIENSFQAFSACKLLYEYRMNEVKRTKELN
jgi:hypothetical protein